MQYHPGLAFVKRDILFMEDFFAVSGVFVEKAFDNVALHNGFFNDFLGILWFDLLVTYSLGTDYHQGAAGTKPLASGGLDSRKHFGLNTGFIKGGPDGRTDIGTAVGQASGSMADQDFRLVRISFVHNLFSQAVQIIKRSEAQSI
jgi:hypothetical protein